MTSTRIAAAGLHRVLPVAALSLLAGCASVNIDRHVDGVNAQTAAFTDGRLTLIRSQEQRAARENTVIELLKAPVGQAEAVQLALANSPALQALLAQNWAEAATAAQGGRIANPVFSFERLRIGDELELGRLLAFGVLDLLTLPQRYGVAQTRIKEAQQRLALEVVDHVTQVRQAWVRAVAAQQNVAYARQVLQSAEASAALARRMQAAGNFNRLARARQQAFYADAATQLANAQHAAISAREALVRLLGLTDGQAGALTLPERLPELPKQARAADEVSKAASSTRLDVQLARTALDAAGKAQGLTRLVSLTDIELGLRRDTVFDNAEGRKLTGRGFEFNVRVPLFDWGDAQRAAMNGQTLAAANQLEATVRAAGSSLRESYSAYRTAYDVARHYRDEVVPLRKTISEENVLRYNGMLIGVFELLADSRDQVATVMAAINAEQQFWLADAALQASIVGKPVMNPIANVGMPNGAGGGETPH